jgi:hypothetical protein
MWLAHRAEKPPDSGGFHEIVAHSMLFDVVGFAESSLILSSVICGPEVLGVHSMTLSALTIMLSGTKSYEVRLEVTILLAPMMASMRGCCRLRWFGVPKWRQAVPSKSSFSGRSR